MNRYQNRELRSVHHAARAASILVLVGCTPDLPTPDPDTHRTDVLEWHARRTGDLKQPEGWFSVVGLFWLDQGTASFGSDPAADLVFPPPAPPRIGNFWRHGDMVRMDVEPGVNVTVAGQPVRTVDLYSDAYEGTTVARVGSLMWYLIERQGQVGVRLKDTAVAAIAEFEGVDTFPVSVAWVIPARFDRYDPPKTIEVPNVLGTISEQPSPGAVVFRMDGKKLRLDVTGDPDAARFFITFGDHTNGNETYGGGRFLSVDAPDDRGRTLVDFNKAHNPPCVFTAFATCPLPPRQNRLSVRIEAGEKMYQGGAHAHER